MSETIKVDNPKKPGKFRIISKETYDANPEKYTLFGAAKPKPKTIKRKAVKRSTKPE